MSLPIITLPITTEIKRFRNITEFIRKTQKQTTQDDIKAAIKELQTKSDRLHAYGYSRYHDGFDVYNMTKHLVNKHYSNLCTESQHITIILKLLDQYKGENDVTNTFGLKNPPIVPSDLEPLFLGPVPNDEQMAILLNMHTIDFEVWDTKNYPLHEWHIQFLQHSDYIMTKWDKFMAQFSQYDTKPSHNFIITCMASILDSNCSLHVIQTMPTKWCTKEILNAFIGAIITVHSNEHNNNYKKILNVQKGQLEDDNGIPDNVLPIGYAKRLTCIVNKFGPNSLTLDAIKIIMAFIIDSYHSPRTRHAICVTHTLVALDSFVGRELSDEEFKDIIECWSYSYGNLKIIQNINCQIVRMLLCKSVVTEEKIMKICEKNNIEIYMFELLLQIGGLKHSEAMFVNAIKSNDAELVKYFLEQKYIVKEEYIFENVRPYKDIGEMLNLMIAYGFVVSPKLYVYIKMLELDKCAPIRDDGLNVTAEIKESVGVINIWGLKKPRFKKIVRMEQLVHVFGTCCREVVEQYVATSTIQPNRLCFEAAMHGFATDTIMYVFDHYGYIPKVFDVIRMHGMEMRFYALNRFYPELAYVAAMDNSGERRNDPRLHRVYKMSEEMGI